MPDSPATAAVSPHLAHLKAREKILLHKIEHRIPKHADRKEESLARAQKHLKQIQEQILAAEKEQRNLPLK
jgi:hypothetical protein